MVRLIWEVWRYTFVLSSAPAFDAELQHTDGSDWRPLTQLPGTAHPHQCLHTCWYSEGEAAEDILQTIFRSQFKFEWNKKRQNFAYAKQLCDLIARTRIATKEIFELRALEIVCEMVPWSDETKSFTVATLQSPMASEVVTVRT